MKHTFLLIIVGIILVGCVSQPTKPNSEVQSLIARAETGDIEAQFKLGTAYDFGEGVRKNGKEAEKWYLLAAESGHAEAQNSLGSGYQAERKYKKALFWYEKAAESNHALAINNLGYLHDLGLGIPQDREKGSKLYLRASELGWAEAMFNLGQMYGSGQFGKKDLIKGCTWTVRALKYSESGRVNNQATDTANYCKQTLSENDYRMAEQEAYSWTPKSFQH